VKPVFSITNEMTNALTIIERARGFLEAATLSPEWIQRMADRAMLLEAHHTTHIEGTHLTLEESERLLAGESVPDADPDDTRELLNYRDAFAFVSEYLNDGGPISEGLIREFYDRDRPAFYAAIQGVRDNGMDLTGWLDYFTTGLATQMDEVKERGTKVIKVDLASRKHALNARQGKVLLACLDDEGAGISDLVKNLSDIPRRTLQRDLSKLTNLDLLTAFGHTTNKRYQLNEKML
jgi:Fic family protein